MAYIGSTPTSQGFIPAVDYFSGNGSTLAFTLSRNVASVYQVEVVIENVVQNPSSAYTVLNNTITFTSAPLSGTNNIYVKYVTISNTLVQPGVGTVGTSQLGDINSISSATTLSLKTNVGIERMKIDASGNVGIGTSSPSSRLDIRSPNVITDALGQVSVYANDFGINYGGSIGLGGAFNSGLSSFTDYVQIAGRKENATSGDYAGYLSFATRVNSGAITERMRIDSSGKVLFGLTTSPDNGRIVADNGGNNWCGVWQAQSQAGTYYFHVNRISGVGNVSTFFSDGTNMIYNASAASIFQTANAERMRIDSSGNVGIGTSTTTPANGRALIIYETSYPRLTLRNSTTGQTSTDGYGLVGVGNDLYVENAEAGNLVFTTSNTERMRIDSSGNVGIGTTAPNNKLTVGAPNSNGGSSCVASFSGANVVNLNTSGMVVITPTDSIAADIGGSIGFAANGTIMYPTGTIAGRRENATANNYASYMQFSTCNSVGTVVEKMRIDSSGNVGIGTTVTSNGLLNLVVDGRALFLAAKTQGAGAEGGEMAWARGTDGTSFWTMDVLAGAAPTIRLISNSGTGVSLASGTTAWGAYSDIRLKTNVMPLRAVLSDIAGIECINYHLKDIDTDEDRIRIGVSAQSLVGKFDEVIDVTQKKKDPTDYLSVRYSDMIPYLVKAIQELKAIIDTQSDTITKLQADVLALKGVK